MSREPLEVVTSFLEAWDRKDLGAMRALVADDLDFAGPFDTFDNADDHHAAVAGLTQIVTGVTIVRAWVDGHDVMAIYELATNGPPGTQPIAEWYHVSEGLIDRIRVYFDGRPYAPLFESG